MKDCGIGKAVGIVKVDGIVMVGRILEHGRVEIGYLSRTRLKDKSLAIMAKWIMEDSGIERLAE